MDQNETEDSSRPISLAVPEEEAELLRAIRRGCPEAESRFVRDYYPGLYRYLLCLSRHPETAEDLTQEAFMLAWQHLEQFQGRAPLRLWLCRIARRQYLRHQQRRHGATSLEQLPDLPAPSADWTDAVELRELLCLLPLEEREVLLLHYAEGYTSAEIARIVRAPASTIRHRLATARARLLRELGEDDLLYLNEPIAPMREWRWLPLDQMRALETRLAGQPTLQQAEDCSMASDKLSRRHFLASAAGAGAVALGAGSDPDVIDDRLTHRVTLAFKATALADLCEALRASTGIHLVASRSVADEKVTVFCEKTPLREVMRQLSRPFGYTWVRSGQPGEYQYELLQDLRSQLLEEELRSRDRNAALLALDREMQQYRPFLDLSPAEAEARARAAGPAEKKRLEDLARHGWGPIQMYFRLSSTEMAALLAGQTLVFSQAPGAGHQGQAGEQPLPADIARGVLQGLRDWRVGPGHQKGDQMGIWTSAKASEYYLPNAPPPAAVPEVRVRVDLSIRQSELGRFAFSGGPGVFSVSDVFKNFDLSGPSGPWAVGANPTILQPDNATLNARLVHDPALRARITVRAEPSCRLEPYPGPLRYPRDQPTPASEAGDRVTSADVLEALHRATGRPIVSDYYTRLHQPEVALVKDQPLFDALNQLADALRLRWSRDEEGGWLRFRSASFYDDRLKEVPNRRLTRWSASRREHSYLTLDDLVETAQLPDAPLDAASMAEGARACFGLVEWELARHPVLRPHLRYLAGFTPAQRQEAMSPTGLLFARMPLAQQQRFIALALRPQDPPLESLDELAEAALHVDYLQPGWFEWLPGGGGPWQNWLTSVEPGPEGGRRAFRPPLRERTREATAQALRQMDPKLQSAIYDSLRRDEPRYVSPTSETPDIYPTQLNLILIYIPGASHKLPISIVSAGLVSSQWTQ